MVHVCVCLTSASVVIYPDLGTHRMTRISNKTLTFEIFLKLFFSYLRTKENEYDNI